MNKNEDDLRLLIFDVLELAGNEVFCAQYYVESYYLITSQREERKNEEFQFLLQQILRHI